MKRGQLLGVWCVAGAFLIAAAAFGSEAPQTMVARAAAQSSGVPAVPGVVPDWGTSPTSAKTILAMGFTTLQSTVEFTYQILPSGYQRYGTTGLAVFESSVDLPSGARVLGIELDGCDTTNSGELQVVLYTSPESYAANADFPAFAQTGVAATPGCGSFAATASPQFTVDNDAYAYGIEVWTSALTNTTSFKAVRIFYQLQVSPAPANPTFSDVGPTDFGYQHIEALAASGVTAGCGGGNFCPNNPVSRAEVAVFLAKALGLHWAP